jgi:hypothetical protein
MTDINNSVANNPLATDPDAIRVAELHERFIEHIKLHGAPTRNDKKFWVCVSEMTPQTLFDCYIFARDHQDWSSDQQDWIDELTERSPFYIRTKSEHYRSSNNNTQIWKLLMQMREVIDSRLKEQEDPRNKFFEFSTS